MKKTVLTIIMLVPWDILFDVSITPKFKKHYIKT